jgi:hypothetical protein
MADVKTAAKETEEGELSGEALQGVTGGSANYANLVMRYDSASDDTDPEDIVMVTCPKCGKKIRPTLFPDHLLQHGKKHGKS